MSSGAIFGPAGNADMFYQQGHLSSIEVPKWLANLGLDAYEYQCGRGVKIGENAARQLGDEFKKYNLALSIHAPYYINLSNTDPVKRKNSMRHILDSARVAEWMCASRVVIHSGACLGMSRECAFERVKNNLVDCLHTMKNMGFSVSLCPETMGKMNQLGTLEEVVEMCLLDDTLIPAIDFGHLNARSLGGLEHKADFEYIFDVLENKLGKYRAKNIHIHYSRIEFTKGGEKKHHKLSDVQFGPDFDPIAEFVSERGMSPVIICESNGTQAEDAVQMKMMYNCYCNQHKNI